jgi:hypothetical protein
MSIDRNEAILRIRKALKARSGKAWSVTGGTGTAWGWIHIQAPPARRDDMGRTSEADRAELGQLLGLEGPVHTQGVNIPASSDYRQEYVDRAEGRSPAVTGKPYWD